MLAASILAIALEVRSIEPLSPKIVLQLFAREFCVHRSKRVKRVKGWRINGWKTTGTDKEHAANFLGYEVPPKHDSYTLRTYGDVIGGKASISASAVKYIDTRPHIYRDGYHAALNIKPDSLIAKEDLESALKVKLIPRGSVDENPGVITISGGGEPTRTTKPYTRWMQHFDSDRTLGDTVSIYARRMWGDIGNQQSWYITCGTYQPPMRQSGS